MILLLPNDLHIIHVQEFSGPKLILSISAGSGQITKLMFYGEGLFLRKKICRPASSLLNDSERKKSGLIANYSPNEAGHSF